jgi:hypothetical protein
MIFIAHRGNLNGPNPERENTPSYIQEALDLGYHVEIDVWVTEDGLFLGHDLPQHPTTVDFLMSSNKMICHAKNAKALVMLITHHIHCFSHDVDNVVLTSKKLLWTYPGKELTSLSIAVMPERASYSDEDLGDIIGVCSDYSDPFYWIKNWFES